MPKRRRNNNNNNNNIEQSNICNIGKYTKSISLKAKSSNGSGDNSLRKHLIDVAAMALTAGERVILPNDINREDIRICLFVAGLFHDLGKAAAGFQKMLSEYDVKKWPENSGGYRHELLSAALFLSNTRDIYESNQLHKLAIYIALISHHKPYRTYDQKNYPKTIPIEQWPDENKIQFICMYKELIINKDTLIEDWNKIIQTIKEDLWVQNLIDNGWIPEKLTIPSIKDIIKKFREYIDTIPFKEGIIDIVSKNKLSNHDKYFISTVRGLLIVGDHLASGGNYFVPQTPILKKYKILNEKIELRPFQKKIGQIKGNAILIAPTGSGKTEAAYAWIQNNQCNNNNKKPGKVFFALPFQASINAMFTRLSKWINNSKENLNNCIIGLQHSRSADVLYSIIETDLHQKLEDKTETNNNVKRKEIDRILNLCLDNNIMTNKNTFSKFIINTTNNKYLNTIRKDKVKKSYKYTESTAAIQLARLTQEVFFPIKVTTPYQILKIFLRGRGWESQINDINNACIVYDEIHAYDPRITGLILGMSKLMIEEFNVNILFMSASFPEFLINKINEVFNTEIPIIKLDPENDQDNMILSKKRHIIDVSDKTIIEMLDDENFINEILNNENTLIICNTVKKSQEVYDKLKPSFIKKHGIDSIILLHSRYKIKDRRTKEQKLMNLEENKIKLVVSTQVVEVSLDIDLSFGIFEVAPMDALIQRLGRVNRKGKRELNKKNIIICKEFDESYKIYSKNHITETYKLLKEKTKKALSEQELVEMINKLYKENPWTEKQNSDFERVLNYTGFKNFRDEIIPANYRIWIDKVIEVNNTYDVILEEDIELYRNLKKNRPMEANGLILSVQLRKKPKKFDNTLYLLDSEYEYTEEYGLKWVNK